MVPEVQAGQVGDCRKHRISLLLTLVTLIVRFRMHILFGILTVIVMMAACYLLLELS